MFSCLALSILTDTLESLVEATPARIGRTYRWFVYDDLHDREEAANPLNITQGQLYPQPHGRICDGGVVILGAPFRGGPEAIKPPH